MTEPRQYGKLWGVKEIVPEDPLRCVEAVKNRGRIGIGESRQCSRKRGHGPDKLYCRIHGKLEQERIDWRSGKRTTRPVKATKPRRKLIVTDAENAGILVAAELTVGLTMISECARKVARAWINISTPRLIDEWHEDMGTVLMWRLPVEEPPECGRPDDPDLRGIYTHWTPLVCPKHERES